MFYGIIISSGTASGHVVINELLRAVKHSDCLLSADDVKICREMKSLYGSWLLQSDIIFECGV